MDPIRFADQLRFRFEFYFFNGWTDVHLRGEGGPVVDGSEHWARENERVASLVLRLTPRPLDG